ncbi:MAG TPA: class V aminotransferase [Sphingomicrobium sp.]|nr:class V aminotransferase [Sphingomicrobium sp.]
MNFKHLFSKSLAADPERLHMAAHSHHLWPDASFEGQVECWDDAARFADRKWDRIMGEVWPEAQRHVAAELGTGMPDSIVFAPNTHELLVRLVAAAPRGKGDPLRVLTSDGEFHSARRQFDRWAESREIALELVAAEPFESFPHRFLERASGGDHDLFFVSQVLFGSGRLFTGVRELAGLSRPEGPWAVVDGYHAFMAIEAPFDQASARSAFYLGGGYKYAMAGEGCAVLHAPPGFGPRPPITGWFAEFEDLTLPPGSVGYASDGRRFMGATFDPSGLYRFNAVQRMLGANGLTTAAISAHVERLQSRLLERIEGTALASAELFNPLDGGPHARFLAFRSPHAKDWCRQFERENCVVDVRCDVLRVGIGLYHDESDVGRFADLASRLTSDVR